MGTGYYVPSIFLHFFAMFGPSILFGSTYHRLLMVLVLVTGPLMSEYLVWGGGQAVRLLEWPSIWCLFSVAQVRPTGCVGRLLQPLAWTEAARAAGSVGVAVNAPSNRRQAAATR